MSETDEKIRQQYADEAALLGRLTSHKPFTSETIAAMDPATLPHTLGYRLDPVTNPRLKSPRNVIGMWMSYRVKAGHIKSLGTIYNHHRLWQVEAPENA